MSRVGTPLSVRVPPAGRMALCLGVGLMLLSADPGRSKTYQLFSVLVAAGAVAVVSRLRFPVRGEARRRVPGAVIPGAEAAVRVAVRNTGRRWWRDVRLVEMPPLAVPSLEEFDSHPEPGEEGRNAFDRFFRYYRFSWLAERHRVFGMAESELFDLGPGCERVVEVRVPAWRRGIMELRDLRVAGEGAFGFVRRLRRIPASPARVAVVPRPMDPGILTGARGVPRPERESKGSPYPVRGQGEDFFALRDYQPGDTPNHIHWRSFARQGRPVVREFEEIPSPRMALALDTRLPTVGSARAQTRAFEAALGCAASLAWRVDQGDSLLELLFAQGRLHRFTGGNGRLHRRRLLEVLAALQPAPCFGAAREWEAGVLAVAGECEILHLLCLDWDEAREALTRRLRAAGAAVEVRVVMPGGMAPRFAPQPGVRLLDAEELFQRLEGGAA